MYWLVEAHTNINRPSLNSYTSIYLHIPPYLKTPKHPTYQLYSRYYGSYQPQKRCLKRHVQRCFRRSVLIKPSNKSINDGLNHPCVNTYVTVYVYTLVLQIPCEKVFGALYMYIYTYIYIYGQIRSSPNPKHDFSEVAARSLKKIPIYIYPIQFN